MSYSKILNFLDEFDGLIFFEHQKILDEYLELLDMKKNYEEPILSKFGLHFEDCSWSKDEATVGPDTCSCERRRRLRIKINNLINRYYLLSERLR